MVTRPRVYGPSPTLRLTITDDLHERAKRSTTGSCLIAEAIKSQYPHFSAVMVDMQMIRVSDRAKGIRYKYLTPEPAQHLLICFDQGWSPTLGELTIKRAFQMDRIAKR